MRVEGIPHKGDAFLDKIAEYITRPALLVWSVVVVGAAIVGFTLGAQSSTPLLLIGAALIAVLLVIGELAAVELRDGSLLSPAPALLIGGLSMTSWPLLIVAVDWHRRSWPGSWPLAPRNCGGRWAGLGDSCCITNRHLQPPAGCAAAQYSREFTGSPTDWGVLLYSRDRDWCN